jgi:hypothetical protein
VSIRDPLSQLRRNKLIAWAIVSALLLPVSFLVINKGSYVLASEPIEYGYRDFSYPSGTGANAEVTAEKPESKLWWNDGYWWGSLWSTSGNAYHIYRLDLGTQSWIDTGTQLDGRKDTKADVLWDQSDQKLYVVSHVWTGSGVYAPLGDRGELFRYSYNAGVYTLDPGFPVEVNSAKTETLVLEKDATGQLWVTYVQEDSTDGEYKVWVNRSLNGDDTAWGLPFILPAGDSAIVDSDDISSIITYNNHIGVMWSNQNSPRTMYFAVHPVGAPDDVWTPVRAYSTSGDDHINLKSLETDDAGNVFAAVKTSNSAELIVLLVCKNNLNRCKNEDDWMSYPVYQSATYSPTRPILLIDTSNRELFILTRNKDSQGDWGIYYKKTSLDSIQFSDDIGFPFIKSSTDTHVNDPTSTKQNLNGTTGLVVLASDSGARYYFHNYMSLSHMPTETPTFTATPTSTSSATPTPTNTPTQTATATMTSTPTPTSTASPTSTSTATSTSTPTSTASHTPTPTSTFTLTPTASHTPESNSTPTETPTSISKASSKMYLPFIVIIRGQP